MSSYEDAPLIKNCWPAWERTGAHEWSRTWHIEFVDDLPFVIPEALPTVPGLQLSLVTSNANRIVLATVAGPEAWSDEIYFEATYRLFTALEGMFGRIRSIEGQERGLWRPFRS